MELKYLTNILRILAIFFTLLFHFFPYSIANTYYISTLQGDDTRSILDARNKLTPWKTIDKLNKNLHFLNGGDSILFNCGEIYFGHLSIKQLNPQIVIFFGSYGHGSKPLLTGMSTLKEWYAVDKNIWKTSLKSNDNTQMVVLQGKLLAKGRYPNYSASNFGYRIYQSFLSNTEIHDNALKNTTNWNGGEIVIQKNDYIIDRNYIVSQEDGNIHYLSSSPYPATNNYGYFIQNHIKTLDNIGEWYFNKSEKEFYIFLQERNPTLNEVFISLQNNIIQLSDCNNIIFKGLIFSGSNSNCISINNCNKVFFLDSEISNSGDNGIYIQNSTFIIIKNNKIHNSYNNGIISLRSNNVCVADNELVNSGMVPGMGGDGGDAYQGIIIRGNNNSVINNRIDSTGYNAIHFEGDSINISNNQINYFTAVKNDGGGIYTWVGEKDKRAYNSRNIEGNTISNGILRSAVNTAVGSFGIYLDHRVMNVQIINNKIIKCQAAGIYLHNVRNISIIGNNISDNGYQLFIRHDKSLPLSPNRNLLVQKNVFRSSLPLSSLFYIESLLDDIAEIGVIDNNIYCSINSKSPISIWTNRNYGELRNYISFKQWQQLSKHDLVSKFSNCN